MAQSTDTPAPNTIEQSSIAWTIPTDQIMPVTTVWCGISTAFHNKVNRTGNKKAFSESFRPQKPTPADLVEHILRGGAWTPNRFGGNGRTKAAFVSGQILALDFDNAEEIAVMDATGQVVKQRNGKPLTQEIKRTIGYASTEAIKSDEFVSRFATLVYASPSSTPDWNKTRVVFILSEPVSGAGRWEALQRGLMRYFARWYPDAQCKDTARLYYGSTNQTDIPLINQGAVLPLSVAALLTTDEALDEYLERAQPPMPRVVVTGAKGERLAQRIYESLLDNIAGAGADRHKVIMDNVRAMAGYAAAGVPGFNAAAIERDAIGVCGTNGYQAKVGLNEVTRIVRDAIKQGGANPLTLTLPADQPKTRKPQATRRAEAGNTEVETVNPLAWKPTRHKPLTNAHRINTPYLTSEHIQTTKNTIAVISDMGTNKTGVAVDISQGADKVLIISPLVRLTESAARRFGTEVYNDGTGTNARWTGVELLNMPKLAITPHSLFKLMVLGIPLPCYDVLVIDEYMATIAALYSPLIPDYRRLIIYKVLKQLIRQAGRVIVMDAHLTDDALEFIRALRGADNVYTLENTYQRPRSSARVYEHKSRAIADAEALINEQSGRAVVIATNSRKEAKKLAQYLSDQYGAASGICIHSENAELEKQADFIRHMADRVNGYRWVIYTPTIGSGVDVSRDSTGAVVRVRAIVGLFMAGTGRRGTTATEMHQQLNRCRFADELLIYIQRRVNQLDINVETLTEHGIKNAEINGRLIADFNEAGIPTLSPEKRKFHRLEAIIQAQRNRSMNNVYADFMTLLTGCQSIDYVYGKDDAMHEALQIVQTMQTEAEKELTLTAPALPPEKLENIPAATRTDEHYAGVTRWQIERVAGIEPITPTLYDLLHTPDNRRRLERLRDLTQGTYQEALERDQHERSDTGKTLLGGGNHAQLFSLYMALFKALGLDSGLAGEIAPAWTPDDLSTALEQVLPENGSEPRHTILTRLFERRGDYSEKPVRVIKYLFEHIGLKLTTKRTGRAKDRQNTYALDSNLLTAMLALAQTSRARWEADRAGFTAPAEAAPCTTNTESIYIPESRDFGTPDELEGVTLPTLPPGSVVLVLPCGLSGSVVNPFSSGYRAEVVNGIIETVQAARLAQGETITADYTDG